MTVSNDKMIKLWSGYTGEHVRDIVGHTASVLSASWSPDSSMLVSCQVEMPLMVWDVSSGSLIGKLDNKGANKASRVDWSADGRFICSAGRDGSLLTWGLFTENYNRNIEE